MNLNCYILCAAGYAETSVRQARLWLQREGIEPLFLGLKSGPVSGASGRTVPAEALISSFIGEEAKRPLPHGLLLAGGTACGQQLLADPRVHLLVQQMLQASKPVGFLHPIAYPLLELLRQGAGEHSFLLQDRLTMVDFMNTFGRQLVRSGTATPSQQTPSLK